MTRRVPDVTKVEALTGWQPKYKLNGILEDVILEARAEVIGGSSDAVSATSPTK